MATLATLYDAKNLVVARCDARCYNGKRGSCYCICGGACHGIGLRLAALYWCTHDTVEGWKNSGQTNPRHTVLVKSRRLALWAHPQFPAFSEPATDLLS
jgi:hypothetical protein